MSLHEVMTSIILGMWAVGYIYIRFSQRKIEDDLTTIKSILQGEKK